MFRHVALGANQNRALLTLSLYLLHIYLCSGSAHGDRRSFDVHSGDDGDDPPSERLTQQLVVDLGVTNSKIERELHEAIRDVIALKSILER